MTRLPLVVCLSVALLSPAFAQTAPQPGTPAARPGAPAPGAQVPGMPPRDTGGTAVKGTGSLKGRVVAAQTGQPLRRAQVSLTVQGGSPANRRNTTTDAEGYYQFGELPAGRFNVSVTKAGYVTLQYGQRRPFEDGTPVSLADGQSLERVDFSLPRGGVIAVRVSDEFGEPVAGVAVQIQRFTYGESGQRRLVTVAGSGSLLGGGTDDRGELRVFGLMPGDYVVQATTRVGAVGQGSDTTEGFAPTYYPGTINPAEAQALSLSIGQELPIQVSLVPSRFHTVSGTIFDSEGRPAGGAGISLVTTTETSMSSSGAGQAGPDGSFVISGVAPGEHSVRATVSRTGRPSESASVPINVSGANITGLELRTSTGATVTGRVVFEGASARGATPPRVRATQMDPTRRMVLPGSPTDPLSDGRIGEDGTFALSGVSGTVFFELQPAQPAWILKAVRLGGQDITDVGLDMTGRSSLTDLEIVMTDKLTTISGQVTDGRGQALRDYVVVIQSSDVKQSIIAARWLRVVRPDTSGRFETRGMRPGRYVATAIEALDRGREFSPEFQQQLRRGAREFTVDEGQTVTLDLRITPDL